MIRSCDQKEQCWISTIEQSCDYFCILFFVKFKVDSPGQSTSELGQYFSGLESTSCIENYQTNGTSRYRTFFMYLV